MGKHFPLPLLTPYPKCSLWQSPHQCRVRIGLYTLSSRQGFCIGYRIAKGVSERCIARLLLTIAQTKQSSILQISQRPALVLPRCLIFTMHPFCYRMDYISVYIFVIYVITMQIYFASCRNFHHASVLTKATCTRNEQSVQSTLFPVSRSLHQMQ